MNATPLSLVDRRMLDAADRAGRPQPLAEARSPAAFGRLLEEVWQANQPRLARLALGLGLKSDQVADILQDTYLAAMREPPAIHDEAGLVRWLFRLTVNRCHLEHRRRGRWRRLWTSLATAWSVRAPSDATYHGELRSEVDRALALLTHEDRTLVVLRYFADLNSRQIGEILGLPEATIRGRLRAARHKLAAELADWNDNA
jgi:RNA polymerase sigma-70 factor, ECF subfamily